MAKTTRVSFFFLAIPMFFLSSASQPQYDYLQYVLQWQPGLCTTPQYVDRCTKLQETFSLRGLWPSSYNTRIHIQDCSARLLKGAEVESLRSELEVCWPNTLGDDFKLWSSQWKKYGTCSHYEPSAYFDTALEFCQFTHDVLNALAFHSIYPNNNQLVSNQTIFTAIRNKFSVSPVLRCDRKNGTADYQLVEVIICFDEWATVLQNCIRKSNCPSMIYFSASP